jgi:putative hydrolase of HD superfamily
MNDRRRLMRLEAQLTFLKELDKLKRVIRQTILVDGSRKENTAEHSWHATMAALILSEYADEPVDVLRVVKMMLVHDIVEIDAGDTFAFDEVGYQDKPEREQQAAARIFGLLPAEQGDEYKALWEEFEAAQSPEAKFANAMDQLMPFLHNIWTEGKGSWKEHRITLEQVLPRYEQRIGVGSSALWEYVQRLLDKATRNGWLISDDKT